MSLFQQLTRQHQSVCLGTSFRNIILHILRQATTGSALTLQIEEDSTPKPVIEVFRMWSVRC